MSVCVGRAEGMGGELGLDAMEEEVENTTCTTGKGTGEGVAGQRHTLYST